MILPFSNKEGFVLVISDGSYNSEEGMERQSKRKRIRKKIRNNNRLSSFLESEKVSLVGKTTLRLQKRGTK